MSSLLSQLKRTPGAGEPQDEPPAERPGLMANPFHNGGQEDPEGDGLREVLRASNGARDLRDPVVAREEAEILVASRAEGPVADAIGRGLFDQHYGAGALEGLAASGLFILRTRQRGAAFLFDLIGRDATGQPDNSGAPVEVCDAGTNIQVKQAPPSPEMLARALVEVARLKGWSSINVESDSELASRVRDHLERMGVQVVRPGARVNTMSGSPSLSAG